MVYRQPKKKKKLTVSVAKVGITVVHICRIYVLFFVVAATAVVVAVVDGGGDSVVGDGNDINGDGGGFILLHLQ